MPIPFPAGTTPPEGGAIKVSLERLARNQVLFREVNERLAEVANAWSTVPTEFCCECSRLDCDEMIELDPTEYEGVRSSSNLFVIAPGHETPEVERIIEENDRFTLVEKTNGAQLVVDTDPRRREP